MRDEPFIADELAKLADLRDRGILTDEEFAQQKSILLNDREVDFDVRYDMSANSAQEIDALTRYLNDAGIEYVWDENELVLPRRYEIELDKILVDEGVASRRPSAIEPTVGARRQSPSTMPAGAWLSIIGGGLAALGSFLPWSSATIAGVSDTRNAFQLGPSEGFSADGVFLLLLGAIAVIIGIVRLTNSEMPRYLQRSPIVLGLGVAGVAINRIGGINDYVHKIDNSCSSICTAAIGFGVYTTFVAAALLLLGGFVLRSQASQWSVDTSLSRFADVPPPPTLDVMWRCPGCGSEWTNNVSGDRCPDCGCSLQWVG
ncbi:MAG TPA: SHOCT domain-containing protein [Acidimicrobiales bacterium]|nr:SHOCT domain-containing protein [Acidimicrobiales bacterium]